MQNQTTKKYPVLYYILIIFMIYFTAKPIPEFDVNFTKISSWIFLGLTLLLIVAKRINITRNFIIITLILLMFNIIALIKYHEFYPRFLLIYWFSFLYAYVTIKIIRNDIFDVIERVIFTWSVYIILPIYLFSLIQPELVMSFLKSLPLSNDSNIVYKSRIYSIIYCYMTEVPYRNSGFGWEPGIYSSLLGLGMFINLLRNEFKLNVRFWLLTVVMFTTFSTTGYIIFALLIIWVFMNRYLKKNYGIFVLPILIGVLFFLVRSEVIAWKFEYNFNEAKKVEREFKAAKKDKDSFVHLQRVASFMVTIKDFKENPVFGTLGNFEDRWYIKKYGKLDNFRAISGIGTFLTIFGLLGLSVFLYAFIRSIKVFKVENKLKNGYFMIIFILIISFSYYVFDSALFYTMVFYYFLNENNMLKKIERFKSIKSSINERKIT